MKKQGVFIGKLRCTERQVINILKKNKTGESVAYLCHKYGMSQVAFYK